jgi:hypothetical protein
MCLAGSLLGCSSKPSDGDISAEVTDFWKGCAKVSDVKKTNGIEGEGGKSYQVAFTYKLEILEDGNREPIKMMSVVINPTEDNPSDSCSSEGGKNSQRSALIGIAHGSIKKGDVYTITSERNMVKSEKGWIFQ